MRLCIACQDTLAGSRICYRVKFAARSQDAAAAPTAPPRRCAICDTPSPELNIWTCHVCQGMGSSCLNLNDSSLLVQALCLMCLAFFPPTMHGFHTCRMHKRIWVAGLTRRAASCTVGPEDWSRSRLGNEAQEIKMISTVWAPSTHSPISAINVTRLCRRWAKLYLGLGCFYRRSIALWSRCKHNFI